MSCICSKTVKILSCLATILGIIALILFVVMHASRKTTEVDMTVESSNNFTLNAATTDHCGWSFYLKEDDDGVSGGGARGKRIGRIVRLFGGGRRLNNDANCSQTLIMVYSPSGAIAYKSFETNEMNFVDTCASKASDWMDNYDPKLKHFGGFFLYVNPSTQAKEIGDYRVISTSRLWVNEYCKEVEEAGSGGWIVLIVFFFLFCLSSCITGIVACCFGCGGCGPTKASPVISVGQPIGQPIGG